LGRYSRPPKRNYSPAARRWIERAFRQRRKKVVRYLVRYEAIVKGQSIVDSLYVIANNEKEALRKAENVVRSFHPNAKGIAVAIQEEHHL
jgi:hypothetical protein